MDIELFLWGGMQLVLLERDKHIALGQLNFELVFN